MYIFFSIYLQKIYYKNIKIKFKINFKSRYSFVELLPKQVKFQIDTSIKFLFLKILI